MKKMLVAPLVLLACSLFAQVSIIPQPVEVKYPRATGHFTINHNTPIILDGSGMENSAHFFNDYLQEIYGFKLNVTNKASVEPGIHLNFERMDHPIAGAYTMEVKNNGIFIGGDNEVGVFYAVQTLLQLLPVDKSTAFNIPFVNIRDYPRFGYRGMHLDVSRHFFPVEYVKRYIDYIAMHKMNYFHWHLTDDQGWRIEIKKYPKLTSVGGYRNGTIIGHHPGIGNDNTHYGGFYTQEQVKEVVAYAAKRYITIIPEVEMPGHASAALTAFPNLGCTGGPYQVQQTWGVFKEVFCAGNDTVFNFLQDVLDEVMPLFPAKYVHIGADECPKDSWKVCPKCQKRMKDNKLKDEHELQSYFVQRMEKYINSKGKTLIGWDEILEGGLAPNAVVMSWRGEKGGIDAAKQKHDVIMTPTTYVYFDYAQSKPEDSLVIGGYLPLEKVYNYEPVPEELTTAEAKHILGAQANLWTEYIKNPRKIEYMIFPRMTALSEVVWSPKEKRNWKDFQARLLTQFKRYELWGTNYSKAFFDLKAAVQPTADNNSVSWAIDSKSNVENVLLTLSEDRFQKQAEQFTLKGSAANLADYKYSSPVTVKKSANYVATLFEKTENGYKKLNEISQSFSINKATGKKVSLVNPPSKNYPGDGPFTLVNGVVNSTGLTNANEFLGFSGSDLEAVIDLGRPDSFSTINVHTLDLPESWIYGPNKVEAFISGNNSEYYPLSEPFIPKKEGFGLSFSNNLKQKAFARYIKVIARNIGPIPKGNPGEGSSAWLFVDEIQVD